MRASGLGAEQRAASADGVSRERGNRAARLLVHGAHARVGAARGARSVPDLPAWSVEPRPGGGARAPSEMRDAVETREYSS